MVEFDATSRVEDLVDTFQITSTTAASGSGCRVVVRGALDAHRGAGLRAVLEEHIVSGRAPVAIDASGIDFLDSEGLRVLIDVDEQLRERTDADTEGSEGSEGLSLVDPSPQVVRLLRFAGLVDRFNPSAS